MGIITDAEDRDAALELLAKFAQPDVEPTLTEDELEDILDQSARGVRWTAGTALSIGALILPTVNNGHYYEVITAGTTTTEPTWPESFGGIVTAGPEFQEAGIFTYLSLYNVRLALRKCWELKASKSSEFISTQDSGSEQMIHENCMRMIRHYSTPVIG